MKKTSLIGGIKENFPSGLVVFLVALPLCLGIALASGAPPLSGIIAGIVGGLVVGSLSNSNISVSGYIWGGTLSGFTIDDDLNAITNIDGENIKADTIDDDSIDFGDITGADFTLTDIAKSTSTMFTWTTGWNTGTSTMRNITSPGGMDIIFDWASTGTPNLCLGACY